MSVIYKYTLLFIVTPQRFLIKLQHTHQFEVGLGGRGCGRGIVVHFTLSMAIGYSSEKGNQWWV
jgi:hypothetical protein